MEFLKDEFQSGEKKTYMLRNDGKLGNDKFNELPYRNVEVTKIYRLQIHPALLLRINTYFVLVITIFGFFIKS